MADAASGGPALDVGWSAEVFRNGLQLIAEGVTELVGFGVAVISLVRGDKLQVVAVSADDDLRAQLSGTRTEVSILLAELEKAENWGLMRFLPHELLSEDMQASGWVPDLEPIEGPDAWHPLDMLIAPLHDARGELLGTMSIDLPLDGRRPGPEQRRMLNRYAEQAGRAVVTALERERLAEQMRLATAARAIVRGASSQLTVADLIDSVEEALVRGFNADGIWVEILGEDGAPPTTYALGVPDVERAPELVELAERTSRRFWQLQSANVVSTEAEPPPDLARDEWKLIHDFHVAVGQTSSLFAPLGAGPMCLGSFVLLRRDGGAEWTAVETSAALDLGHDLGQAILNARTYEREHRLVQELQELDTYKSQLIATICHELKNPLSSLVGHLEMLEGTEFSASGNRLSLAAMERSADRMSGLVENLLTLSRVGDPSTELVRERVDLGAVLDDVVDLLRLPAERRSVELVVDPPAEPVHTPGDAGELDRVLANLVSNAVKYTPPERTVTLTLRADGDEAVFTCADQGYGISAEDLERLFEEFFRSSNPAAIASPGTGLGLAIVQRIVERHDGTIHVESTLGEGSTFQVRLPLAPRA